VLSHFFPDHADEFGTVLADMGVSRLYAGIHYRFNITAAVELGAAVGDWALAVDQSTALLATMH